MAEDGKTSFAFEPRKEGAGKKPFGKKFGGKTPFAKKPAETNGTHEPEPAAVATATGPEKPAKPKKARAKKAAEPAE
jgi:hypothetical protein